MTTNAPSYTQHDKIKALDGRNQTVGDFIDWLREAGYVICERCKATEDTEWQTHWPTMKTRNNLIAEFFEIDEYELSREKDWMLENFRRATKIVNGGG